MKRLAHLCRRPNTSTVDDAPQGRASLLRPQDDLFNHLDDVFDLRDIQLVEFYLARCRSNGSCVRLFEIQDGDISFLLKDALDCR